MIYKNQDCLEFLKSLDDNVVDLICTDPPYYRVVNDEWDNQWFTIDEYYDWCKKWITELGRVAKWNCSFWLFGFPQQTSQIGRFHLALEPYHRVFHAPNPQSFGRHH